LPKCGDPESKIAAMEEAGIRVSPSPARFGKTLVEVLKGQSNRPFLLSELRNKHSVSMWRFRHSALGCPLYLQQCSICARIHELRRMFAALICLLV
jgi:hypothetical protein